MKKILLLLSFIAGINSINAQDSLYEYHDGHPWCKFSPATDNAGNLTKSLPTGPYPPNTQQICGAIRVTFMDVYNASGIGFDDPTLGLTRRNCVCNAMNYIQSVIVFPATINASNPVDVIFMPSLNTLIDPRLGFAAPIFPPAFFASIPDYYSGYVYDFITTGVNPAPPNEEHGQITMNFGHPFSYCTPLIGNCEFDFESVVIHEFTHLLGVGSLINENITTSILESGWAPNVFTEWDRVYLYYLDGSGTFNKMVDISAFSGSGGINPVLPANMFGSGATSNRVWTINTPLTNRTNQPVHSRWAGYLSGTTLSHLDEEYLLRCSYSPAFSPNYVMNGSINLHRFKNVLTKEELRILEGLGYTINTGTVLNYLNLPPSINGSVVNPNFAYFPESTIPVGNSNIYISTSNCNPVTINVLTNNINNGSTSHPLGIYDAEGDPITIFDGQVFNLRGCSNGGNNNNQLVVSSGNDIITFTPRTNFVGRAQFAFHLFDGTDRGAYVVITIDVNQDACFNNGIEHVINGNFDEGMLVRTVPIPNATLTNDGIDVSWHYIGNRFCDGQQYLGFGWQDQRVRDSYQMCLFGGAASSFPAPGTAFLPTGGIGDRYTDFANIESFHVMLAPQLLNCHNYILEFDIAFSSSVPIGTTVPFAIALRNTIGGTNLFSTTIPITNTGVGIWNHVVLPITYSSSTPANYFFIDPVGFGYNHIDNLTIYDDLTNPGTFPIVSINPSSSQICSGQSITLTASGASSYLWSYGSTTVSGNPIIDNPTTTTTYTVIGTDANGCSATSSVTVIVDVNCSTNPDCALPTTLPTIPNGATSNTTSIPPNSVVDVQGLFTINSTVTYDNVKFKMAAGARIDIVSGNTLTLKGCHLFSCTQLWKEITVNPNANLNVQSYTIIEDAEKAIHWSNGGSVNINSSIFNRNGAGLHLEGAPTAPNVKVSNTIFTCRDFPPSVYTSLNVPTFIALKNSLYNNSVIYPYGSLIAPAAPNTRSLYGVISSQVAATIGITGSSQKRNLFDYLDFGIQVTTANFIVINNAFANISGYDASTAVIGGMKGIGVYANAKANVTITVGGTNLLNRNLFKNCYRGANITDYATINFINNILTNTTTSPTFAPPSYHIGHYGLAIFSIKQPISTVLNYTIINNSIDNNATGIFINSIYTQIAGQNIQLANNNLNVTGSGTYCNQGIWMQSLAGSSAVTGGVNVTNNTVRNSEINALLFENVNDMLNVNINNELSVAFNSNQSKQVIRLNNCKAAVVSDNGSIRTTNNNTTIPTGSPSNFITGIYLGNCQSSVVTCNTIRFVDVCVLFDQSNSMDQFRTNDMNKARIGLVLANGAIIGQQGDATHPSGNVWGPHNPTNIKNFHTYTFSTFTANVSSKLYCKTNQQTNCAVGFKTLPCSNGADVPANVYVIGGGLQTATGISPNCTAKMGNALANTKALLHEADSGNGSAVDKFLQKRQAFHLIKTDTTGMLLADNELNTFYNQELPQNLGKISATNDLIGNNSFVAAQSTNSSITPTNVAEHNTKAVNDIWLQSLLDTAYVLTTADSSTLYTIGSICMQQGGDATVLARALLTNFTQTALTFSDCMELPFEDAGNRTANNKTVDGNLILNGSIEEINWDSTDYAMFTPWKFPQWTSPDVFLPTGFPSFFSSDDTNVVGYQLPQDGVNYFGGYYFAKTPASHINYTREPIIAKTSITLSSGVQYCLSYYISLADIENCAVNRSDAYFSPTPMDPTLWASPYLIYLQPQVMADSTIFYTDKENWMRIEGSYTAVGGENYITFGNLHLDSETDTLCNGIVPGYPNNKEAYYYMDNFSLEEIKPVDAGLDITITSGDTIVIGNNADSASSYVWSPNYFIADMGAVNATVNPPVTTTYYVTKTQCSVTTTDTVTVSVTVGVSEVMNENNVQIYPNPNNGSFTITHNLNEENYVLEIIDLMGKVVHQEMLTTTKQEVKTQQLNTGLYFVNFKSTTGELMYSTKISIIY